MVFRLWMVYKMVGNICVYCVVFVILLRCVAPGDMLLNTVVLCWLYLCFVLCIPNLAPPALVVSCIIRKMIIDLYLDDKEGPLSVKVMSSLLSNRTSSLR